MEETKLKLRELLCSLEERLVQHDNSRKEAQNQIQNKNAEALKTINEIEEEFIEKVQELTEEREKRVSELIRRLNEEGCKSDALIKEIDHELRCGHKFEIACPGDSCAPRIRTKKAKHNPSSLVYSTDDPEVLTNMLKENLDKFHKITAIRQSKFLEMFALLRREADKLEKNVNDTLKPHFEQEEARIRSAVKLIKERIDSENLEELKEIETKTRLTLVKNQKYTIGTKENKKCGLIVVNEPSLKYIGFEERKPSNVVVTFTSEGKLSLSFSFFENDEIEVLKSMNLSFKATLNARIKNRDEGTVTEKIFTKTYTPGDRNEICFDDMFSTSMIYYLKMRLEHSDLCTKWSDEVELATPWFRERCAWKRYSGHAYDGKRYSVDEKNPRIASINEFSCTLLGNIFIPLNVVTSWSIKILKTKNVGVNDIYIGVAPSDMDQGEDNSKFYYLMGGGWYFSCRDSELKSGYPHCYRHRKYGQRKKYGEYMHDGDSVGVVMDTTKGELSFVLGGVNYGAAYEGIPLDKPLVPCAILKWGNDEVVELDLTEVKENEVDDSIPVPSNMAANLISQNSITLRWDNIVGVSLYQIEVDGSKSWDISTTNMFEKNGLYPDTEHSFRVRAVWRSSVSKWSDIIKGKTLKVPEFSECVWNNCPRSINRSMKYALNRRNHRIVTKTGDNDVSSTITGNLFIPPNAVTSWGIKTLKSGSNERGISVGVAPFDIDQGEEKNSLKCGWYFETYFSILHSGPPHSYRFDEGYGDWLGFKKEYAYEEDVVGVVMDTIKGKLSFVLEGINRGVAYHDIPLDKPLVPCVILYSVGDSVELVFLK